MVIEQVVLLSSHDRIVRWYEEFVVGVKSGAYRRAEFICHVPSYIAIKARTRVLWFPKRRSRTRKAHRTSPETKLSKIRYNTL